MSAYAGLLDRLDPSERLRKVRSGEVTEPHAVYQQPPDIVGFPPAFVPLRGSHTSAVGLWVAPFDEPRCRFVWHSLEAPTEHPPCGSTVDDYIRLRAIEMWEQGRSESEVSAWLQALNATLDFAAVETNNANGLTPEASLVAMGARRPAPLVSVSDPHPAFEKAVGARDLATAWIALNSSGWRFSHVEAALVVLQDLSNNADVADLANGWIASHDEVRSKAGVGNVY